MEDPVVESVAMIDAWWRSLGGVATTTVRIAIILLLAWLFSMAVRRGIRLLRERVANRLDDPEAVKRADTLARVARYLVLVVVSLVTGMLVLSEIGVSVAPVLGAAGVVGLAIGFGAQSLVKDYFTGFFLLLENQIRQGDVVKLGDHAGLVEVVTLRYVQLRDYDGNVHFVPNGTISSVINMSRGFAQSVMDIRVSYREDIDHVMQVMLEVAAGMRADPKYKGAILDDFEMAGVDRLDESAVVVRGRFRTAPLQQWNIRREYHKRLKGAFDVAGISIPGRRITLQGPQPDAEQPAPIPLQLMRGERPVPAT